MASGFFDVYLGRGGHSNQLRKNSLYSELLNSNFQEYASLESKFKKAFAFERIVNKIKKLGGRFYKEAPGKTVFNSLWEEVDDKTSIRAVMQALRDRAKEHSAADKKRRNRLLDRTAKSKPASQSQRSRKKRASASNANNTVAKMARTASVTPCPSSPEQSCIPPQPEVDPKQNSLTTATCFSHTVNESSATSELSMQSLLCRIQRLEGLVCFLIQENDRNHAISREDDGAFHTV